ncbi:MAG: type II secretion system protein [Phycisphaeraceae bacterium]
MSHSYAIDPAAAPRQNVRAFTLIELLVVVGIIALLMAILLPALGRAREQATRVSCASNLRQFGQAYGSYAHDNNSQFPANKFLGGPWANPLDNTEERHVPEYREFLNEYLMVLTEEVYRKESSSVVVCPNTWFDPEAANYYYNSTLLGYFTFPHRVLTSWQTVPETQGWMTRSRFDGPYSRAPVASDIQRVHEDGWVYAANGMQVANHATDAARYSGGNFLFEDASVRWFHDDEISVGSGRAGDPWPPHFLIAVPGIVD